MTTGGPPLLGAIGIDDIGDRVYRALLARVTATVGQLAEATAVPPERVRVALRPLLAIGLAQREPGGHAYRAAPPDSALQSAVLQRQEELVRQQRLLEDVRSAIPELDRVHRAGSVSSDPREVVEIVSGLTEVRARFGEIQRTAANEVIGFTSGLQRHTDVPLNTVELDHLARGIRHRAIYDRAFLESPGALDRLETYVAAGEEARTVDELPVKMVVVDRVVALVSLAGDDPGRAVAVRPSGLLDALVAMFERTWDVAVPVAGTVDPGRLTDLERRILLLLAGGSKDETIARQLKVSLTTVRRHVAVLLDRFEADTRFQAGVNAARRGFL